MWDNVPIYHHNQTYLKRVLCVADLQQCDIYATVLSAIQP